MKKDSSEVAPQEAPVAPASDPEQKARTMAMLIHLSTFAGAIFPFLNLVAPLILWQMKRTEHALIDDQGKEVVNFQITITIAYIISGILIFLLIGFLLLPIVFLVDLILTIIGAVKANQGVNYRYPVNIRFIK